MNVKLVADWKSAWTWYSLHVSIVIDVLNAAYLLSDKVYAIVPSKYLAGAMLVLSMVLKVVRVIDQTGLAPVLAASTPTAPESK
jgi:hypothetical protein